MRTIDYTFDDGFIKRVVIPNNAPDEHGKWGIVLGPPDLSALNLPRRLQIDLNNELLRSGFITAQDVRRKNNEIFGVLQRVFRTDTITIMNLYTNGGTE